ncbi:MAG: gamma-glutamyl-phosphate reductase, partial [Bacteroidales bacterium]|nr:gamma-glutamyl-phosphate reductase [Bacteroidales bacterium]
MKVLFIEARKAGKALAALSDETRNKILLAVADEMIASKAELLRANELDLARMDRRSPLYDRLMLTEARIEGIAADMRNVALLPTPLGRVMLDRVLPNGLHLRKVAVPFGVIGVIYEARPNVTFDVFSLCFKSGNACVLKGGKDADDSNCAAIAIIQRVL